MKRYLKKLIIVLSVFSIVSSSCFTTYAVANVNDKTDNSINIVTTDSFSELFALTTEKTFANTRIRNSVNIDVNYEYIFMKQEDNELCADVELSFELTVDDVSYTIIATGIVEAYELMSGRILWEGLIRGNTIINDMNCKVLVGFAKMEESGEIQANVTIQSTESVESFTPVVFSFGDLVILEDIKPDVSNVQSNDSLLVQPTGAVTPVVDFTLLSTKYANFSDTVSGNAQRARVYFQAEQNRLAVTIKSYVSTVDNYFSQYESSGTYTFPSLERKTSSSQVLSTLSYLSSGIFWFKRSGFLYAPFFIGIFVNSNLLIIFHHSIV